LKKNSLGLFGKILGKKVRFFDWVKKK
jgi:hypothetical protein